MSAARPTYRIGEFARLAGVTVRALHHYDRLGLLCPERGVGGYRVYTIRDLELLEQIVVLKFVGIPLRRIADLLRASPRLLVTHLRAQRGTLERKRQLVDRAIAAIGDLEASIMAGTGAGPHMYKRIIEVIDMHEDATAWKQQYDELVSTKIERLRALSPQAMSDLRARWSELVTDIQAVLTEDPASPDAQALGERWTGLLSQLMGQQIDSDVLSGHQRSREWDPSMSSFVDKHVWDFMTRVLSARG